MTTAVAKPIKISPAKRNLALMTICLTHACLMGSITLSAALGPQLIMTYGLTTAEFTAMTMVSYLTGAIFGIPLGIFGDKAKVNNAIFVGIAVATVGAAMRPFVEGYGLMYFSNFIIGFGLAGLNANSVKFLNPWWGQKINMGMGFYTSSASIGTALAMLVPAWTGSMEGSFFVALGAMVFACVLWLCLGKMPDGYTPPAGKVSVKDYVKVAKIPTVWLSSLAMGCAMAGAVSVVMMSTSSMVLGKGFPEDFANQIVSINNVLAVAAGFCIPILVDRINKYRVSVAVFAFLSGAVLIAFWMAGDVTATCAFFIAQAIFPGGVIPTVKSSIGMIKRVVAHPETIGAAGGIQAAMQNLLAFVVPAFIVTPIAGDNFQLFWILTACEWWLAGVFVLLMRKSDLIEIGKNAGSIEEQTAHMREELG